MNDRLDIRREHVVAGGPDDFMEVRHLVLGGSNRAIGRHLAELARDRLGCRKEPWTDPAATRAQKAFLEEHWPGHRERARGVADVYGIAADDQGRDSSFLYYQWAVPGCSVAFYPPPTVSGGRAILARNYDFSTGGATELLRGTPLAGEAPATSRPFILELHPDVGYSTLTLCTYELLGGATDGINSEGLSVALLADAETLSGAYRPLRTSGVGISEIQTVRWLLETCRNADEARAALARTPQFYIDVPCHYMVADSSGDSFVWELGFTDHPRLIEGDASRVSTVTNHLLYDHDRIAEHVEESVGRRATLECAIEDNGPLHQLSDIEAASRRVAATAPAGVGQYAGASLARTLWHAFYDLTKCELVIDFYLGDDPATKLIKRSSQRRFAFGEAPGIGAAPPLSGAAATSPL
ncbi:MAG: linear amide C-N hydrolase [Deltaproteobacteria bacterium]|nr:linear amide C-N hydrolase [Deltaproteobacteria bacterium]